MNKNSNNGRALDYNTVKEFIESKGYKLISTEYKNTHSPLEVICPKGHKYITSYERIKNSKNGGCEICKKNDKSKTMATSYSDVYKHIDSLGYILLTPESEYKGQKEVAKVKCKAKGHVRITTIMNLRQHPICQVCKKENRIKQLRDRLSLINYTLILDNIDDYDRTNLTVKCDKGHIYKTCDEYIMAGNKCLQCDLDHRKISQRLDYDFVKDQFNNEGYELLSTEYNGNSSKLLVRCPVGHEYEVSYANFSRGRRCPHCNNNVSIGENRIMKYLNYYNIPYIHQHKFEDCKYINVLFFDFYLPQYKLAIEFDGKQHFQAIECFGGEDAFNKAKIRDNIKDTYCFNNGIFLYRIPYTQINNINIILDNIFNMIGETSTTKSPLISLGPVEGTLVPPFTMCK